MKKKLGFYSIVLLTINSIIGTGIFLSPGGVVAKAGDKALIIYIMAAIFASVLAVTFASAAKYVSKGGASYAYAKAAFGDNIGFYVGITRYIAASIAWGVMGTAVVKTVLNMFGFDNGNLTYVTIGFVILMGILLVINLLGTRLFELINNLSTIGKVGALVTTILVGLAIVLFTGVNEFDTIKNLTDSTGAKLGENMDISAYVMAVIAAFYAFTGFESVACGAQDMEEPEKNLPKAIPLAIGIIAVIYLGIVGTAMMINPSAIVTTKEVVALAAVFSNPIIRTIILVGALVSMFGINVAASFHTPRILEAMAMQNQVPEWFKVRTSKDFPLRAFLVTIGAAILLPMAFQYNMTSIIVLSSISRFIQFIIVPLAVMVFYFGKQKEEIVASAKKSFVFDVIVPFFGCILTVILLYKFNWASQFTIVSKSGDVSLNTFAIVAMIIGYLVLPVGLMIWRNVKEKRHKMKRLSSEKIPAAVGSYSPATLVGNLIFTSGQLPINRSTGKIDEDTIEWQVSQSLNNIKSILEDNHSSMDKIVKTTVYLSNITDFKAFNEVYQAFFNGDYPARTAFQVGALPMGALVEIEAIAEVEE